MRGTPFRTRLAIAASCAGLLGVPGALAQSATGSISGRVLDAAGAAAPGVAVEATNTSTGVARKTTSGRGGSFSIPLLPVGLYTVAADRAGFAAARIVNVGVAVGTDAALKLILEPAAFTVSSGTPLIEATRSQVSSVVTERSIQNLPANGRSFVDFVLTTPGVVKDNLRAGDFVFAGQRGTLNSLVVDGGDNNNTFFGQALGRTGTGRAPYQFSEDAVEEFQVNASSFPADAGRAGGAVINVVTKSGARDFHGSAFSYYRDEDLNAKDYTDAVAGRAKSPYHFDQFGATLGGPLVRDGVFFFASYDGQRNQSLNSVIFPAPGVVIPTDADSQAGLARLETLASSWDRNQDQDVGFVKLDAEVGSGSHASVRYNRQDFTGRGFENGGSSVAFQNTGDSLVKTDTVAGSLTSSFTAVLFNEFRGQYARDREPGTANSSLPEATVQQGGATLLVIGENFFSPRETTVTRFQLADTGTYRLGNHTLKAGADYVHDDILNYFPGNFFGSYTFASLASFNNGTPNGAGEQYVQAFAGPGTTGATTHPDLRDFAGFVQDRWQAGPGLTVNLGLRYDLQSIAQPNVLNADPQLLAAGLLTNRIPVDKNAFGPRIGLAWTPGGADSTVVRGGYGIFYGRTPALMVASAQSNNGINVQTLTFSGASVPTYPGVFATPPAGGVAAAPTIALFDPTFKNPRVQQASFGVDQLLTSDLAVSLFYLHVKGSDLPRSTDINIAPGIATTVPVQGEGTSASFTRFAGAKPFANFDRIIEFQSTARSEYNGVTVELSRRYSDTWQARLAYTYGKATDTKSDATAVVPNSSDDAKFASNPANLEADNAPADSDVRHRLVFSAVWNPDFSGDTRNAVMRFLTSGWTLSGIISFQTGMPYSLTVNGDLNNDGNARNDLVPGSVRNSQRLPSILSVNPRVSRHIPIGPVDLELIAEAFNVFNARNVVGLQSNQYQVVTAGGQLQLAPVSTFLKPCAGGQGCTAQAPLTASTGPRIIQLAARASF